MGELIQLETAIDRKLPFASIEGFSFEFKRCLLKALSLSQNGMSEKDAVIKSGFERVWIKEGHGKVIKKEG